MAKQKKVKKLSLLERHQKAMGASLKAFDPAPSQNIFGKKKERRRANRVATAQSGSLPGAPPKMLPINRGNPWSSLLSSISKGIKASTGKITTRKTKARIASGTRSEEVVARPRPKVEANLPPAEIYGSGRTRTVGIDQYEHTKVFRPSKKVLTAAERKLHHKEADRRYRLKHKIGRQSGVTRVNKKGAVYATTRRGQESMQAGSLGKG